MMKKHHKSMETRTITVDISGKEHHCMARRSNTICNMGLQMDLRSKNE